MKIITKQRTKSLLIKTSVFALALIYSFYFVACVQITPSVPAQATALPPIATPEASPAPATLQESQPLDTDGVLTVEAPGFESPEDAAKEYLEGLKDANLARMMSAFAVESYVKNYSFEAVLNRLGAYTQGQEIKLPNANELVTAINIESRRSSVTNMILRQYSALCRLEFDQAQTQIMEEETDVKEFIEQFNETLNTPNLETLKVLGFVPPEALAEKYLVETNQENLAKLAQVCGADKQVSCVAVFELNGSKYILCLDAISYGGKWYIREFGGNIGALLIISAYLVGTMPVPEEVYEEFHSLLVPIA